jgi:hypothetical protein
MIRVCGCQANGWRSLAYQEELAPGVWRGWKWLVWQLFIGSMAVHRWQGLFSDNGDAYAMSPVWML